MKKILIYFSVLFVTTNFLNSCAVALVGGGAAGGYYAEKNKTAIKNYSSDAVITSKIKARYLKDLALKSFAVSVTTNQGIVILSGTVPKQVLKDRAIYIAQQTGGVKTVDASHLIVHVN